MQTECNPGLFEFAAVAGRAVVGDFGGGSITSDAGGLLLGQADRVIKLTERFAGCFRDSRCQELIEHEVKTLIGQRVFGIALGYEDLSDHDELRHDPVSEFVPLLCSKRYMQRPLTTHRSRHSVLSNRGVRNAG